MLCGREASISRPLKDHGALAESRLKKRRYFHVHISTAASLSVIITILGSGVAASLLFPPEEKR